MSCRRKFWNEDFFSQLFKSQSDKCRIKESLLISVAILPSWVSFFHNLTGRLPLKRSKNCNYLIHLFKRKHLCIFLCLPQFRLPLVSLFPWLSWDVLSCLCDVPTFPRSSKTRMRAVWVLNAVCHGGARFFSSKRHHGHQGALEMSPCWNQQHQSEDASSNNIIKSRLAYQPSCGISDLYMEQKGNVPWLLRSLSASGATVVCKS